MIVVDLTWMTVFNLGRSPLLDTLTVVADAHRLRCDAMVITALMLASSRNDLATVRHVLLW